MKWVQCPIMKPLEKEDESKYSCYTAQRTNQTDLADKSGIQKQKQQLDRRMQLHYKVVIEQIEQVQIDVT